MRKRMLPSDYSFHRRCCHLNEAYNMLRLEALDQTTPKLQEKGQLINIESEFEQWCANLQTVTHITGLRLSLEHMQGFNDMADVDLATQT